MTNDTFRGTLMEIIDAGVKEYDDYICEIGTRTRWIGKEDGDKLAAIHSRTIEEAREWLDIWMAEEGQHPLEIGMIADILFNTRFLWYIYVKCGDRKEGWVRALNDLVSTTVQHSIESMDHPIEV